MNVAITNAANTIPIFFIFFLFSPPNSSLIILRYLLV